MPHEATQQVKPIVMVLSFDFCYPSSLLQLLHLSINYCSIGRPKQNKRFLIINVVFSLSKFTF